MTAKNTVSLWFDKDAHDAAQFYAKGAVSIALRNDRSV
jgi:predicted 3-demethylubiquinone-9 3-methyltransferase (glyoxalase superfamily)